MVDGLVKGIAYGVVILINGGLAIWAMPCNPAGTLINAFAVGVIAGLWLAELLSKED